MFSTKDMPSPSSLFTAYASMAASLMLFRSMANDLIPAPIRHHLAAALHRLFKTHTSKRTLVIDESTSMTRNQLYDAATVYLATKISPTTERLKVSKALKEKNLKITLDKGEKLSDTFQDIALQWKYVCAESSDKPGPMGDPFYPRGSEKRLFELSFDKRHQKRVQELYLPFVLEKAKMIGNEERVLRMFTLNSSYRECGGIKWDPINLEHPAKFETLAMDSALKASVIEDLDRFVRRKEFYKRVGRAWKRGYLLYGPPGTGKSSLVAAIANYLKFDVYDLQLANIMRDSDLRRLLLATANRSILVIEDIDCSVDLPDRHRVGGADGRKKADNYQHHHQHQQQQDITTSRTCLTLSGLLNFIDGLWSSCGDERIIIFTTNHKERLDPALLRPGRMDMHIHMSYCTYQGFKLLALNYLEIQGGHKLFGEIELLMDEAEVTPAQVAEELMRSEDADVALEGLVKLLKRKKMEGDEKDGQNDVVKNQKAKRQKIEQTKRKQVVKSARRKTNLRARGNLRSSK